MYSVPAYTERFSQAETTGKSGWKIWSSEPYELSLSFKSGLKWSVYVNYSSCIVKHRSSLIDQNITDQCHWAARCRCRQFSRRWFTFDHATRRTSSHVEASRRFFPETLLAAATECSIKKEPKRHEVTSNDNTVVPLSSPPFWMNLRNLTWFWCHISSFTENATRLHALCAGQQWVFSRGEWPSVSCNEACFMRESRKASYATSRWNTREGELSVRETWRISHRFCKCRRYQHTPHLLAFENQLFEKEHSNEELAKTMMVFMVRGLCTNLQYPYVQFPVHSLTGDLLFGSLLGSCVSPWEAGVKVQHSTCTVYVLMAGFMHMLCVIGSLVFIYIGAWGHFRWCYSESQAGEDSWP